MYLAALATAVIPLVIHLLNRRQQKRLRFPAVRFVLISQRRVARTYNLRNWLLLAVRTLAIIFLVLLMAHPLWETGVGLSARGAPLSAVIIVDNSLSMQVREEGAPFTEAKQAAEQILEALDGGDRAAVIATNPVGRAAPRLRDPREAALKDLGPLAVTAGAADFAGALRAAYGLLREAGGQKALWVVTDLGLSGWDRLSLPEVGEYDPTLTMKIVAVGSSGTPPSATVKTLAPRAAHVAPGLDIGLAATLGSFAAGAARDVTARLTIDGKVRDEKQVTLPADADATVAFRFQLDRPGSRSGHVSLHGDGLSGNLRHYFTLHTRDRLNVLLVDGDPQRALVASETFFLSRALNPTGDLSNSVLLPEVILGRRLGQVEFPNGFGTIIVHHVLGHADAVERNARGTMRHVIRQPLVDMGQGQDQLPGQLHLGRLDARQTGQDLEHLFQRQVAAPQDVPLAGAPALHGAHVAHGHVIHVDEVHAGFHVGHHAPLHEIHDDLPGRGRLHVTHAHRRRGVHDHHGHSRIRRFQDLLLGQILGALVMPGHLRQGHRGLLRARPTAGGQPDRADRTRVHDAVHARVARRVQQRLRAVDVRLVEHGRIARPQGIMRGHVVDLPAAVKRRPQ